MEPHQQRVWDEKVALDTKVSALDKFMQGDIFRELHQEEKDDLVDQLLAMRKYSSILYKRIRRFPGVLEFPKDFTK